MNGLESQTGDRQSWAPPRTRVAVERRDPSESRHGCRTAGWCRAVRGRGLLVQRWLAEDCLSPSEARELRARLARLQVLYQRHITVEDQELFPAAARVLDSAQLRQIGREMAARREIRSDISLA